MMDARNAELFHQFALLAVRAHEREYTIPEVCTSALRFLIVLLKSQDFCAEEACALLTEAWDHVEVIMVRESEPSDAN